MPLVGFCMLFMSGFYNIKHLSWIRNSVHQIFRPLCAQKSTTYELIKMFSMLPIPNFVLPIPPTSIVVPSTIQVTSRSWLKISNSSTISRRTFVCGCSCGSSVQSRVVCTILLCISKKAKLQPGWLSTSLFCVQGSMPPSHIPASPSNAANWILKIIIS